MKAGVTVGCAVLRHSWLAGLALALFLPATSGAAPLAAVERIEIGALRLRFAATGSFEAQQIQLSPATARGGEDWAVSAARLQLAGDGWRTGQFALAAGLRTEKDGIQLRGQLTAAATTVATFHIVRDANGLYGRFETPELVIGSGGLPASTLFTALPREVEDFAGRLEAGVVVAITDTHEERAWLSIDGASLTVSGIMLSDISARLACDSLSPPRSLPGQRLRIGRIVAGLPAGPFEALFEISQDARIAVRRASLTLAGGRIVTQPFELELRQPQGTLTAAVEGLDLERLAAEIEVAGLAMTGRLDGSAVLRLAPGQGLIAEPVLLQAREPGVLRWSSGDGVLATDPSLALLQEVVRDFHYHHLEAELRGPLAAELQLRVSLEGANPAVYGGYPIALDLRFEGPLGRILRQGLRGYRLPGALGETVRDRLR